MRGRDGTALVVIDLQRQFTDPDGLVPVSDGKQLVDRVNDVVDDARQVRIPVIWVEQRVRLGIGAGATSARFGVAGIHRGESADLDPGLRVASEDIRVVKRQQSAFCGTDLDHTLRRLGVNRLLLAGVTTNVCVLATAKDAAERDLEVVTLADLTACRPIERGPYPLEADEVQRSALAFIQYAYGEVRHSDQLPWR